MPQNGFIREDPSQFSGARVEKLKAVSKLRARKWVASVYRRIEGGGAGLVPVVRCLAAEEEKVILVEVREPGGVLDELAERADRERIYAVDSSGTQEAGDLLCDLWFYPSHGVLNNVRYERQSKLPNGIELSGPAKARSDDRAKLAGSAPASC
jgi:hypothetical protein